VAAAANPEQGDSVQRMASVTEVGDDHVEGIDRPRVTRWMTEHVADIEPPLRFELIAGGRSNLTYRVTDASGQRYALRRPPLSHVLPTAHDMAREYRVITSLGPTAVPVPRTLGLCVDDAVNDRPFYVMEFVEGHILRDAETTARSLDERGRRRAGESLVDTLAALHDVDVDAVGLGDFAKRDGYIERQLRRWYEQFTRSQVEGIDTATVVEEVHRRLSADIPVQSGASIVHGDYRLDNTVLGVDGTVRAVLDWEICTLGDPLADVGLLMVYWTDPGDEAALLGVTPTTVPGFPDRAEMKARYRAASGRDLERLDFYVAFGYWKLACILQGVFARYVGGAAAGDRSSVDGFGSSVVRLADMALSTLEAS
jgi:aminoglycoside phosphotransferase (APT) family kinase protein